jgi:hypothetical protein
LGNGGIKKTKTYNEDPRLNYFAETLRTTGAFLLSRIINGQVSLHNNTLYQSLTFTIALPDAEK